jgi:ubiquitin-like domain-containing CTD phosphatase 1
MSVICWQREEESGTLSRRDKLERLENARFRHFWHVFGGVALKPTTSDTAQMSSQFADLVCSFRKDKHDIRLPLAFSIGQLKAQLEALTSVPCERQKLLNLIKGKLPTDNVLLSSLSLSPGQTFMLMGTPDAELLAANEQVDDVIDDFDYDCDMESIIKLEENKSRLAACIEKTAIGLIHPRISISLILILVRTPAKKLCVFDLDYTLFDCKSQVRVSLFSNKKGWSYKSVGEARDA